MKGHGYKPPSPGAMENRHETTDVSARLVAWAAVILLAVVVASMWLLHVTMPLFAREQANKTVPAIPPQPRLQANPVVDLAELQHAEEEVLSGYRWVDRERGIVSIPIEKAMQKKLERGFPVRQEESQ